MDIHVARVVRPHTHADAFYEHSRQSGLNADWQTGRARRSRDTDADVDLRAGAVFAV